MDRSTLRMQIYRVGFSCFNPNCCLRTCEGGKFHENGNTDERIHTFDVDKISVGASKSEKVSSCKSISVCGGIQGRF